MGLLKYCWLWITVFGMYACSADPLDVDVSKVPPVAVKISRYDRAFFGLDTNNMRNGMEGLNKQYPGFSQAFIQNIVCAQSPDSISCDLAIRDFLINHITRGAWEDACTKLGEDFSKEEAMISDAYRHFLFHFGERKLPNGVALVMTGFNYNYLHSEGYYGIGMEFFLGQDHLYYNALQWPMYKRRTLSREYMIPGLIRSWMMNEFPYSSERNDVINRMVYEGKILYLQKALLRGVADTLITGFTAKQTEWCLENEGQMWAKLIEDGVLYSESEDDLNHLVQDAPFTPGFPRESPGKAGAWLGLRIVEAFMEKNPSVTLQQLMDTGDGQAILNRSKYKPKL